MKSEKFEKEMRNFLKGRKEQKLYNRWIDDHLEKVGKIDVGYKKWLIKSFAYLTNNYKLEGKNVLEIGCGMGEFTVTLALEGYNVVGVDIFEVTLRIARVLAKENNVNTNFIKYNGDMLPFDDHSFDIICAFSVVEHIDDKTLQKLLSEISRVSRGVVYILVPNKLKAFDDHSGLRFVPFLPRKLAQIYIKMRGEKYRYAISDTEDWDVYFRYFPKLKRITQQYFDIQPMPEEFIYPPFNDSLIRKFGIKYFPIPTDFLIRRGFSLLNFESYINMVLKPKGKY